MEFNAPLVVIIQNRQTGQNALIEAFNRNLHWLQSTFKAGCGEENFFHIFYTIVAQSKGISVYQAKDIYNPLPLYDLWEELYFYKKYKGGVLTLAPLVVDKEFKRDKFFHFVKLLSICRY